MSYDFRDFFLKNSSMMNKDYLKKFEQFMKKYMSTHSAFFASKGLIDCPTFGMEYEKRLCEIAGVDVKEYMKYIKASKNIEHEFEVSTKISYHIPLFSYIFYNTKNRKEYVEFLAIIIYTGRYHWNLKTGARADIVEYMFNNRMNNNFYIYKYPNILEAIRVTVNVALTKYRDRLEKPTDDNMVYFLNAIYRRINSMLLNVTKLYYEIYEGEDINRTKIEKSISDEEMTITLVTNTDTINNIITTFKETEMKNGVKTLTYLIVDKPRRYIDNLRTLYREDLILVYSITITMINIFSRKRKASAPLIKNYFCADVFAGKIKSTELTQLLEQAVETSLVKKVNKEEYKKIIIRYLALRIREIANDMV